MGLNKAWTEDEELFLQEHWGRRGGIKSISRLLGRSENAILCRAQKLNLGPYLMGGEYISFNVLNETIVGNVRGKSYVFNLKRWQDNGLPIHKIRVKNCFFNMVDIDEFWVWAKQNQDLLDFSRFEENALGKEPEWVKRKRKIDVANRSIMLPLKCPWSEQELAILRLMTERGTTYEELEKALRRSAGAIRRKIYDLYLPPPPEEACNTVERGRYAETKPHDRGRLQQRLLREGARQTGEHHPK